MPRPLWPHELQHARLPCPSVSPRVGSKLCPLNKWCYPTIWSSVAWFSSHPQSFPASGLFQWVDFITSGGQNIGVSPSVLPMNVHCWFPLGLTGLISLLSKRLSGAFSSTTVFKHQLLSTQSSLWSKYHIHTWLLEKP